MYQVLPYAWIQNEKLTYLYWLSCQEHHRTLRKQSIDNCLHTIYFEWTDSWNFALTQQMNVSSSFSLAYTFYRSFSLSYSVFLLLIHLFWNIDRHFLSQKCHLTVNLCLYLAIIIKMMWKWHFCPSVQNCMTLFQVLLLDKTHWNACIWGT